MLGAFQSQDGFISPMSSGKKLGKESKEEEELQNHWGLTKEEMGYNIIWDGLLCSHLGH